MLTHFVTNFSILPPPDIKRNENYKFNSNIKMNYQASSINKRGFSFGYLCPLYFIFLSNLVFYVNEAKNFTKGKPKEKTFSRTTQNYRFSIFQQHIFSSLSELGEKKRE